MISEYLDLKIQLLGFMIARKRNLENIAEKLGRQNIIFADIGIAEADNLITDREMKFRFIPEYFLTYETK